MRHRRNSADLSRRAARLQNAVPSAPKPAAVALDLFGPGEGARPSTTRQVARPGDLLESGPHRFYIASIPGVLGELRIMDRETGQEVERGNWIGMYERTERLNGLT